MRQIIDRDPYENLPHNHSWFKRGIWPCYWVSCPSAGPAPFVSAYRKAFSLSQARSIRVHVSADERYELYLDGQRIGRGPERGDPRNWFFETYDLDLTPGDHLIVARVWSFGDKAPNAQMSVYPGFLFSPQEPADIPLLGTGVAAWEAKRLSGYGFVDVSIPDAYFAVGSNLRVDGRDFDWGFERGEGDGWQPVTRRHEAANGATRVEIDPMHLLKPASLPPMLDQPAPSGRVRFVGNASSDDLSAVPVAETNNLSGEIAGWGALFAGNKSMTLPAHTARRVIVDLGNYFCAYPKVVLSGGAASQVRVSWAESLFTQPRSWSKGNRDEIEGKVFVGLGDTFISDGGDQRGYDTLWWRAGRYLEVYVTTAETPLTIESLSLQETRYPIENEMVFNASDPRLEAITPIAIRALQMCSHETYMDCPYYEQLMYVGDTRLEVLATYVLTHDDRLPRKAISLFNASRLPSGLTQSRYPSRVMQIIPPFSLWWIGMLHDFAMWRDDRAFVQSMMPGVRGVVDYFKSTLNADGLVQAPNGWNFMDWVPIWESGIAAQGELGVSGVINWHTALALTMAARLEAWSGESELEARDRRLAASLSKAIADRFWDEGRGMFADDAEHTLYSEHTQCLAILTGLLSEERAARVAKGLLTAPDLARTTIYFTHYLFETYARLGAMDAFFERLKLWFDLEPNGFKTTFEMPEPSRSDCHGWGSHPLYHYFASILGIRPASAGFATVSIRPQPGSLSQVSGSLPHPRGSIAVELRKTGASIRGQITLPAGVSGEFIYNGKVLPLKPGNQEVAVD